MVLEEEQEAFQIYFHQACYHNNPYKRHQLLSDSMPHRHWGSLSDCCKRPHSLMMLAEWAVWVLEWVRVSAPVLGLVQEVPHCQPLESCNNPEWQTEQCVRIKVSFECTFHPSVQYNSTETQTHTELNQSIQINHIQNSFFLSFVHFYSPA